jgi:hypothetical protein
VIVAIESHQGAIDMQVTTIGLDIAKNVFQVHGIDAADAEASSLVLLRCYAHPPSCGRRVLCQCAA